MKERKINWRKEERKINGENKRMKCERKKWKGRYGDGKMKKDKKIKIKEAGEKMEWEKK